MNPAQQNFQNNPDPMADEGRPQREVAQRVFAAEFNASTFETKEGGERSPSYVISPFGTKINRLFAVGVLTNSENIGASGDMWKAQVVDPTGIFNVYAGQYQPEATSALAEIRPPAVVAIVGKSRTYQPETGVTYVSIRPETIRAVDKHERDAWILETVRHSMLRLDALREAQKLETPNAKALQDLGYPQDVAEGVVKALEHYGAPELNRYATMLRDALETLLPGASERMSAAPEFATAATSYTPPARAASTPPTPAPATAKPPTVPAKADNEHETHILTLVERLDDGKGAPWEDVVAEASKKNIKESDVEECLNNLMDKGQIYEPVLGRLKKT